MYNPAYITYSKLRKVNFGLYLLNIGVTTDLNSISPSNRNDHIYNESTTTPELKNVTTLIAKLQSMPYQIKVMFTLYWIAIAPAKKNILEYMRATVHT